MARDRKRAKQRRDRRESALGRSAAVRNGEAGSNGEPELAPGQVVHTEVPAELEHASGGIDEFDAALLRGAGGVPVAPAPEEEQELGAEDELEELDGGAPPALGGPPSQGGGGGGGGGRGGEAARPSGAPLRGGNRAIGFLRASWAELQRVQWPDRRQVTQATAVVIGFVAIAGAYLGLADLVAKEIVEAIL